MGHSSPQTARSHAGWADDLVAIVDALGHHEFGVTGWSEGGPWATTVPPDAELLYRRWAFDVKTIERRVHMWQGLDGVFEIAADELNA